MQLACGVLSALLIARGSYNDGVTINQLDVTMLNPKLQKWYAKNYMRYCPETKNLVDQFNNLDFIIHNSDGIYHKSTADKEIEEALE